MLVIALLAAVLVACGGGNDAAPTEPTAVAEAPPAAAPTEAPAVAPTEAPAEVPTEAPTVAPTDVPAEAPSGGASLSGECANAFYPVIDGRTMNYVTSMESIDDSAYSLIYSNVTESSFDQSTAINGETMVTATWTCTAGGMLSPQFSQFPGGMEGAEIEVVEFDGLTVPPEEMFQPGQSWQTHYITNMRMPVLGSDTPMEMTQVIDFTNEVVGIEAISVPAGDYSEAVRVNIVGTIVQSMLVDGTPQPLGTVNLTYSSWYVEGVGMVLTVYDDVMGMGASRTELVSIEYNN